MFNNEESRKRIIHVNEEKDIKDLKTEEKHLEVNNEINGKEFSWNNLNKQYIYYVIG